MSRIARKKSGGAGAVGFRYERLPLDEPYDIPAATAAALASAHVKPSRVRRLTVAGDPVSALRARRAVAALGGLWPLDAVTLKLAHQRPQELVTAAAGRRGELVEEREVGRIIT